MLDICKANLVDVKIYKGQLCDLEKISRKR